MSGYLLLVILVGTWLAVIGILLAIVERKTRIHVHYYDASKESMIGKV